METTIELPDDILYRAQCVAIQRCVTLEELVLRGLEHELGRGSDDAGSTEALVAALSVGRNSEPIARLDREEIYDREILR